MKVEIVCLDYVQFFLVVDGTRGPVQYYRERPATHPKGFLAFRPDMDHPFKGKVLRVMDEEEAEITIIEEEVCLPAQNAYNEYSELINECQKIKLARYDEAVNEKEPKE